MDRRLLSWRMDRSDRKNMDTYSHQADLNALSKLYWLVQVGDPGGQSLVTKVLDECSAIFLRKLLDDATTKIYENMTKELEQSEDYLEMRYRSRTSSSDRSAHKKVVEEKTSKVECPRVINGALDRIASLGPKLEHLSKPYSNSIASSSTSSYEKTASNSASRFSSDFSLSSATQFGTSLSRTTSSHSTFSSSFDHGDDELSPSEYYQSRQRSHKKMGKLSKLKDKLGTIFHHHHHHHHHHHGQHPRDTEASGSLWKKDGKLFRKVEAQIEKKYIGTKKVKAEVQKRPEISKGKHARRNKLQGGNLQDPVGGLTRNAKNPNKPKQGGRETNCIKVTQKPGDKIHQRRKGLRLRR